MAVTLQQSRPWCTLFRYTDTRARFTGVQNTAIEISAWDSPTVDSGDHEIEILFPLRAERPLNKRRHSAVMASNFHSSDVNRKHDPSAREKIKQANQSSLTQLKISKLND